MPQRSNFYKRMMTQRQSTNIEDRRPPQGVAPIGSAGYPVGDPERGMAAPDLNNPVPRGAPSFDARQGYMKAKADMVRMGEWEPAKPLPKLKDKMFKKR